MPYHQDLQLSLIIENLFIDSDPNTWVFDLVACEKAMQKYRPRALISVDLYGQSCDYDAILDLCNKYNVFLIEDAAEALGADYKEINAALLVKWVCYHLME